MPSPLRRGGPEFLYIYRACIPLNFLKMLEIVDETHVALGGLQLLCFRPREVSEYEDQVFL
jgi:hypothetical protein